MLKPPSPPPPPTLWARMPTALVPQKYIGYFPGCQAFLHRDEVRVAAAAAADPDAPKDSPMELMMTSHWKQNR